MLRHKTETRPGLVALYDIRPETERVNSYNPGPARGVRLEYDIDRVIFNRFRVIAV